MKFKRFISAMAAVLMLISTTGAFAEEELVFTGEDTEAVENTEETADTEIELVKVETVDPAKLSTTLKITMDLIDHPIMVDTVARIYLYSDSGEYLGMDEAWVGGITKNITFDYTVPQYELGETFIAKFSGLRYVTYGTTNYAPGEEIRLGTYGYNDETGAFKQGTSFAMTGDKPYELQPVIYTPDGLQKLSPAAKVVNGTTMVPVFAMSKALGLTAKKDEKYNSVAVSVGDKCVAYNIGSKVTNVFGKDEEMSAPTTELNGSIYVPVRTLAQYFNCTLEVLDFGDHIDVILGESKTVKEYYSKYVVNKNGISSRTGWLIYVDKSDYRVRVYQGQQYQWREVKSYPCAIGAPGTPTITGQFEYMSKESIWPYNGYYVGPIMRFYNGYALHSTLRYYGGGEYDGRVGVQISHGCIRLHPEDITWMWNNIPLYTKVYITE